MTKIPTLVAVQSDVVREDALRCFPGSRSVTEYPEGGGPAHVEQWARQINKELKTLGGPVRLVVDWLFPVRVIDAPAVQIVQVNHPTWKEKPPWDREDSHD